MSATPKSDIPNVLPRRQRMPASFKASAGIPDSLRGLIEFAINGLRGKHPAVYLPVLDDIVGPIIDAAPPDRTDDELALCAGRVIAAFIELAGLEQDKVNSPFFAAIYRQSIKHNHVVAAVKYIKRHGGWQQVTKVMSDWIASDPPELREEIMATIAGSNVEPEAPETPRQSVERIVGIARDMLNGAGMVPDLFCVLDRDGRGLMLWNTKGNSSREAARRFLDRAQQIGREMVPGACRCIRANEAWSAPADSPVRPSKSDQRTEIVSIMMWDDEAEIDGEASTIDIERDANGKAYAGKVHIAYGRGGTTDMDRIFGSGEAPS